MFISGVSLGLFYPHKAMLRFKSSAIIPPGNAAPPTASIPPFLFSGPHLALFFSIEALPILPYIIHFHSVFNPTVVTWGPGGRLEN